MSSSCSLWGEPADRNIQKQFWMAVALCATLWTLLVIGTMIAR